MMLQLAWSDWIQLFMHFATLSLLAVGGAITTAPDMHRFLVTEHGWLTDSQFNTSIAMAQAAPGPNVLFVALMGWNVGLNNGSWQSAVVGMLGCLIAVMLPSSMLVYFTSRWSHQNRDLPAVKAFKTGLAPVVIALLISTGWLLAAAHGHLAQNWPLWAVSAISTLLVWKTRLHLLWLLGAGALLGALGYV